MRGSPYWVIVCDLFHSHEPDHETVVVGFPTAEIAVEYARRRVWSSVEEMRGPDKSPEEVRHLWRSFGEDCRVVGPDGVIYVASSEIERFLARPATPEERDWVGLYHALLPDDFALTYTWAAGSYPPPDHYEYELTAGPENRGTLRFWPDYPGSQVPVWEQAFPVLFKRRLLLYNLLRACGLLDSEEGAVPAFGSDEAIGGETAILEVTARGQHATIAVHRLPEEDYAEIHAAIRALPPEHVWEEMEARRQEYVQRIYG